jgi:serine acetyltransferase
MRFARKGLGAVALIVGTLSRIDLTWGARIGRRVVFAHQGGIVVGWGATIGDDCLVRQNVTIGLGHDGGGAPRIGRNVRIGVGAVIVGDVTIGDGAVIGPNTVVTTDVPPKARVVAAPPRILFAAEEATEPPPESERDCDNSEAPDAAEVAFVLQGVLGSGTGIEIDTPLLSTGLVDSLNVAVVLDALERRYVVRVPPETVSVETFDTPRQIADYLVARRSR